MDGFVASDVLSSGGVCVSMLQEHSDKIRAAEAALEDAAAEAGVELVRLREEVQRLHTEASEARGRYEDEMRERQEKLAEAEAQVRASVVVYYVFASPTALVDSRHGVFFSVRTRVTMPRHGAGV